MINIFLVLSVLSLAGAIVFLWFELKNVKSEYKQFAKYQITQMDWMLGTLEEYQDSLFIMEKILREALEKAGLNPHGLGRKVSYNNQRESLNEYLSAMKTHKQKKFFHEGVLFVEPDDKDKH